MPPREPSVLIADPTWPIKCICPWVSPKCTLIPPKKRKKKGEMHHKKKCGHQKMPPPMRLLPPKKKIKKMGGVHSFVSQCPAQRGSLLLWVTPSGWFHRCHGGLIEALCLKPSCCQSNAILAHLLQEPLEHFAGLLLFYHP